MKARRDRAAGFTLIEVMFAMAILGVSLMGLLSLQHQGLQSVIRSQDMTQAAMLAQTVITQAEFDRFPVIGRTSGNFESLFPGKYRNYRWQRIVSASGMFPDVRKVTVFVYYGPKLGRSFSLTEFLHSPMPPEAQNQP
ncbi:MAG: prepilin-type N-terminal cleavage/methylation domain-containing protein [Candidatus Binatus sp.]|uniref:prepilin-type N-terminal cleavage/methylation domain-containing protein n=1 Tax=Candidatus Binatus sp. TaxID=2811406 RepID=UPI00271BCC84|nr:prepilin-type N-terminal cleavage/methylation domain-containing protein [Candidatus Binatus sp.]MDO8432968.1 prepilin-type N-terminal cleavage/methylation domain-containing protein [Candidatus Binatus sp.]